MNICSSSVGRRTLIRRGPSERRNGGSKACGGSNSRPRTSQKLTCCRRYVFVASGWVPWKKGEGLPDALPSLLEDSNHGGSWSIHDQGEWRGQIRLCKKIISRQACFTLIASCDECWGPGDRMGIINFGVGKDVEKRVLNGLCVVRNRR